MIKLLACFVLVACTVAYPSTDFVDYDGLDIETTVVPDSHDEDTAVSEMFPEENEELEATTEEEGVFLFPDNSEEVPEEEPEYEKSNIVTDEWDYEPSTDGYFQ